MPAGPVQAVPPPPPAATEPKQVRRVLHLHRPLEQAWALASDAGAPISCRKELPFRRIWGDSKSQQAARFPPAFG